MSEEMEMEEEVVIDLEEIRKKYEDKGFFRRLADMCVGLGNPHNTREYKLARIEVQRLMAPLIAILAVVLFVGALIVITAVPFRLASVIVSDGAAKGSASGTSVWLAVTVFSSPASR